MKLLVCGGAGFIGSAFIRNYLKNNPDGSIINLDSLTVGSNKANLESVENFPNYVFVKDDIKNPTTINTLTKDVDAIVNFAAETHVDRSIANPLPFIETNIFGTFVLLEAARKSDKLFFHVSTDEVYGDAVGRDSFTENDVLHPSNPYSATKASADLLVEAFQRTYGMKCMTSRCTNNFGPYQFPEKLIPKTIILALKNEKIPIYGDGNQQRSWIYVLDHVDAIETLLKKGKPGQVYNITAWKEVSNITIVEKILNYLKKPLELIENVGDRPGHDKKYSVNSSKIEQTIGWKSKYQFDQALNETITWYQNNKSWWEHTISKKILHHQPWTLDW